MIPLSKPYIGEEEIKATKQVLESGWLTSGPKAQEFEDLFSKYIGVKHAISLNSCTSALHVSLMSLNIKGEVIVPSFTFAATANAVVTAGAKPVFADIEEDTCCIDPAEIEGKINEKTEAIIPVHYAGHPCDMKSIMDIAESHGLMVIEDSAQCIGGEFSGKRTGGFGRAGCFSFFPTKNITTGEGGMITTNDDNMANLARTLKAHGMSSDTYERERKEKPWLRASIEAGYNLRMPDICACIGVEQMRKLEKMNSMRIKAASLLTEMLDGCGASLPIVKPNCKHVFQMYTIKLPNGHDRTDFIRNIRKEGVQASVHYDPPVHLQPYYAGKHCSLPVTESVSQRIVTLPFYPGISNEDLVTISSAVRKFMA